MSLPIFHSPSRELLMLQTAWAGQLNPLLNNFLSAPVLLKSIVLAVGSNTINHTLGRTLQGWFIVRQRASGSVYDTQDSNTTPALTLLLTSSAAVTIDLVVF